MKQASIILASSIVLLSALTACQSDSKLKQLIEAEAAECPMEVSRGFILERVTDNGICVTYRYIYTDSLHNPGAIQSKYGIEPMKQTTLRALKESAEMKDFIHEIIKADRGLSYVYIGTPSADSCSLSISADEIKDFFQSSE